MDTPKILITGGCGFIGVNLINYLLRKGFSNIRILDNLSSGAKENLEDALRENGEIISRIKNKQIIYEYTNILNENIQNKVIVDLIIGDVRSYEMCLKATRSIDAIVHLAAHTGVIPSIENPFYDFEVNIQGTLNFLHTAVKNKVDKFIFASSNAPLGDQNPPMSEEKVPKPLSPYGASKLACEGYCSAFYGSYGLKTVSLRFSNVYGPHCLHKNSVIAKFIKDGIMKETLTIYGEGKQTRDFLYVEDICQAITLILNPSFSNPEANPESLPLNPNVWGEIFHLGTGRETRIIDLAEIVRKLFGAKIQIVFEPPRSGEIKRNYSNIGKSVKILQYNPTIELEDGVRKVYAWFLKQGEKRIKSVIVQSGSE